MIKSSTIEGGEWFTGSVIKGRPDLAEFKFKAQEGDRFIFQSNDHQIEVISTDAVIERLSKSVPEQLGLTQEDLYKAFNPHVVQKAKWSK